MESALNLQAINRGHIEIGLIVLIILVSVGFCYQERQSAANRARAEIAEQKADSLYVVVEESTAILATVDAAANEQIREAETRREEAETRAAQAVQQRPQIITRTVTQLIEAGADSTAATEAVEQLERSYEQETRALRTMLAAADTIIAAQRAQLEATTRVNTDLRAALEASRAEANEWERAATPRLLGLRISPGVAFVAGAIAASTIFVITSR